MSPSSLRWLAPATFLVLWSAGFSFVALGLPDSEPITFLALRYAIVVAVLVPAFLVLRPPLPDSGATGSTSWWSGWCCRPPTSPCSTSPSTWRARPGPWH
ncbi:MAG TPA: hypothetical protein VES62_04840 [Thermoleophilaceae bacterium]|nr:hypothetical protein [Thermoleophilaceae bacterium]